MEEQGQNLTKEAETYEADLSRYQKEVDKFNKQIEAAAKSLSCAGIFGILAIIPLINFVKLVRQRNSAVANRDKAKNNLAEVSRKQESLAAMQADFEKFRPNIEDICLKLGIFAGIWAFVTSQSIQLNESLEGGMRVVTERKFVAKLANLRAQIKPLVEGLNAYVVQIVPRPTNAE
ncbi:hypothetical protein Agabi119p4_9643 [Agaricus bisporus var. burnettii]|uniref:Uncharacterized protein n=1 Tax=Agaricus bisporus var. burnettii TaxID=192524 RepID=A0A8H7EX06_AGABI|nr:hypothetical protein Agabi119p4_9643 [Agaricus bisporus var. burnettii]